MSVIISQFYGARDEKRLKNAVVTSFYLILGLSLLFSLLGALFSRKILEYMRVPANVLDDATTYLRIIFLGSVATAIYNVTFSLSRAVGDSLTPMLVLILTSILNVALNILFVASFGMGVAGVAYATIISTAISAVVSGVLLWRKTPILHPTHESLKADPAIVRMIVKIGVPSALQSAAMAVGHLTLQVLVNGYGSTVMAALAGATKIEALVAYPPGGLTGGMQIFTGQNVGAGQFDRVRHGFRTVLALIGGYAALTAPTFILFGRAFMGLFTSQGGEMVEVGYTYLVIAGLGSFLCGLVFHTRSTLIGAGDASMAVVISFLDIGVRIVAAIVLSRFFGYVGVFLATPVGWLVAGGYGTYRYLSGKWQHKRLTKEAPAPVVA